VDVHPVRSVQHERRLVHRASSLVWRSPPTLPRTSTVSVSVSVLPESGLQWLDMKDGDVVHWAVGDAGGAQMKLTDALEQEGTDQFAQLRRLVAGSLLDLHEDWAPKGYGRASAGNLSLDAVAAYVGQLLERRYDSRNPWESRMRAYIPDVLRAPHRRTGIRDRTGARTTMLVTWFAEGLEWSDREQSHLRDLVTVCMKHLSSPPIPVQPPRPSVDDPRTSTTPT